MGDLTRRRRIAPTLAVVLVTGLLTFLVPGGDSRSARAATTSAGYWLVASDGGIFAFGGAPFLGSTGALSLNHPVVGMAAAPSGRGYWLVASDGGIFAFGDAGFFGSTGAVPLNRPIVGMAATPSGRGYWLVASDGGIFAFGDAAFHGSAGAVRLTQPISGMAATPTGRGYWMTAADGGVFAFGDAAFLGAASAVPDPIGARRVIGIVAGTAGGYWQTSASGEVLPFGDAADHGRAPLTPRPIVGMAAAPPAAAASDPWSSEDSPVPGPAAEQSSPITPTTIPAPAVPLPPPPQFFSSVADTTWGTGPSRVEAKKAGRVLALAEAGGKVFVAGEFAGMVPPGGGPVTDRPYLAALDVTTGALLDWDAQPDGPVLSLAVSPDGRTLYVGGRFSQIGGRPAGRIAALDVETARADPDFRPPPASSGVRAMVLSGDTLFIGGDFTRLGDVDRPQVAAVDATTGALRTRFAPPENTGGRYKGQAGTPTDDGNDGLVYDMAIAADGSSLLVVGDFLHFGGQGGVLVLDADSGKPTSWQPTMSRPVFGVSVWPGDGKTFFVATGGTGGQVQAFKLGGKSTKPLWVHKTDGDTTDVVATTERVYLVGHYDYVLGKHTTCGQPPCAGGSDGDVPNRHISVFDARSGAHDLSFTAQLNTPQGPYVALVGTDKLFVGGDFTEVNGMSQPGFVQFPARR